MSDIKILGIQFQPENGNKKANLQIVKKLFEKKFEAKNPTDKDIVILPEVFNSGVEHNSLQKCAEKIPDGETTEFLSSLAAKYNTNIVGGSIIEKTQDEEGQETYKNTSVVFGRQGEILCKYRKIHLFDHYGSSESSYISAGDRAVVVQTDVAKLGLSICYDLRFPELYRTLAYEGAEIIVCPAAWPYPRLEHWKVLNRARAIENTVYIAAVNQCGRVNVKRHNLGLSMLVNPWGDIISCAGSEEGFFEGVADLEYLSKIRNEFSVLQDRCPESYRV